MSIDQKLSNNIHSHISIDGLVIAKFSRSVFKEMQLGKITAANCTCSVWENFNETINKCHFYLFIGITCIHRQREQSLSTPTFVSKTSIRAKFCRWGPAKCGKKNKSRGTPLGKAFFCEGQAALSLEAFSRLWEAWGGHWEVGRCFRRLWGGFGKPYHRKTRKTVNLLPIKQH